MCHSRPSCPVLGKYTSSSVSVMNQQSTSLWMATGPAPKFDSVRDGGHFDVVIVGGGITGLTAAVLLKNHGRRVAVVEKDRIASGESGHTTAHLTEAIDA